MRPYFITGLMTGVFLCLLAGCDVNQDNIENPDADLIPLENGINFSVKEVHDQSDLLNKAVEPFIELELKTKSFFPSGGHRIVSELSRGDSGLSVTISGIKKPGGPATGALAPAVERFPLDLKPGNYRLNFIYEGIHTFGLAVTDSSLIVSDNDTSFATPEIRVFWRFPEQTFAYLCRSTAEARRFCREFEQILNDSLDITSFSFPDFGTIPYPAKGEKSDIDIATYYRFSDETIFDNAGRMLNAYADTVLGSRDDALLWIINWKNRGIRSWTDVGE